MNGKKEREIAYCCSILTHVPCIFYFVKQPTKSQLQRNCTLPCSVRTGQAQQKHQHTDCIYGHHTDRLRKNCNNNDFTPFYFKLDNFNVLKMLLQ